METLAIIVGFVAGRIAGRMLDKNRHRSEVDIAYITGHVDGYSKAVADSGEVAP
jgi:uncharacterized membrane protein YeaQ/YmgE (transglycosylase-associated protein family)